MKAPLTLRIDIDFPQLSADTVPTLLAVLEKNDMKASFFITASASRPGSLLRRLSHFPYIRRILGLGSGWSLGKLLLDMRAPAGPPPELPDIVREIQRGGHEVAVHGYDHVWWADYAWTASPERIEEEIERAYACFCSASGTDRLAWASPGWRSTDHVMKVLRDRGVPYLSECWGRRPFMTGLGDGSLIRIPHLPVSLPCLESLRTAEHLGPEDAARRILGLLKAGGYNMLCVHDYFEGCLGKKYFSALLERCGEQSIQTETAAAAAARMGEGLPVFSMSRCTVPGFEGMVSSQGVPV